LRRSIGNFLRFRAAHRGPSVVRARAVRRPAHRCGRGDRPWSRWCSRVRPGM